MRELVAFFALLVIVSFVIFSSGYLVVNINDNDKENKEETKAFEFSTFTSAVCENNLDSVHCKDEIFVNCDGKISKAGDLKECNGFEVEIPKALGFAVFEKDWNDPRN
jgi:hypothetical protein